jgi:two-component system OmpR family sensor kinase
MRSLRRTLVVRFSLTMFLALLLISLWAFLGTHFSLSRQLNESLTSTLQLEAAALAARLPVGFQSNSNDLDAFIRQINRFVTVRDSTGNIITSNTPFTDIPVDQESFARARLGDRSFVTQDWGQRRIRSLYAPVPEGSLVGASVVQVAASLEPLAEFERSIFLLMLATVVLGTAATVFGASWMADSAAAPVAAITKQAKSIMPRTAGNRITAHADVVEFTGLVGVLNDMLDRLDGALAQQRRMIADLGHDLRTPLTAMRGELEVALRSERTSEEYRSTLESSLEEVERLHAISEGVVMLARLEAGELTPEKIPVDIYDLVTDAAERVRCGAANWTIEVGDPPSEGTGIRVDAKMLSYVFGELFYNVVQHTPPGTRAFVAVESGEGGISVSVSDDGPGIPEQDLPHVFERLYRHDAARSRTAGSGLGLTISAAILAAHQGSMTASRSSLGGLEIIAQLPRRSDSPTTPSSDSTC